MSRVIRLDVSNVEGELPAIVQRHLNDIGIEFVNFVKLESPVGATGDLRRGWQILGEREGVVTAGSNVPHAADVQEGTDPHWAPISPLLVWARRVLGAESAAHGVQRKIAREGTDPNPYIDRAIDRTIDKIST